MRTSQVLFSILLCALTILLSCGGPERPRVSAGDECRWGLSRVITEIPGFPGRRITASITAEEDFSDPFGETALLSLQVCNDDTQPIKLVVCGMLDLIEAFTPSAEILIDYDPFFQQWTCQDTFNFVNNPVNFHYGCKRVSIAGASDIDNDGVLDRASTYVWNNAPGTFSEKINGRLGAVYLDFLEDAPLLSCDLAVGEDIFLRPSSISMTNRWFNAWTDIGPYTAVPASRNAASPQVASSSSWLAGNWVTMGSDGDFPAIYIGKITNPPAGATIELFYNGELGAQFTARQELFGDPCEGADIHFKDGLVLNRHSGRNEVRITATPECPLAPNTSTLVDIDVFATQASAAYQVDQLMHRINVEVVHDTSSPVLISTHSEVVPGTARNGGSDQVKITAIGFDEAQYPAMAYLHYRYDDGPSTMIPMLRGTPFMVQHATNTGRFEVLVPAPTGSQELNYEVRFDDHSGQVMQSENIVHVPQTPTPDPVLNPNETFAQLCVAGECDSQQGTFQTDMVVVPIIDDFTHLNGSLLLESLELELENTLTAVLEHNTLGQSTGQVSDVMLSLNHDDAVETPITNGAFSFQDLNFNIEGDLEVALSEEACLLFREAVGACEGSTGVELDLSNINLAGTLTAANNQYTLSIDGSIELILSAGFSVLEIHFNLEQSFPIEFCSELDPWRVQSYEAGDIVSNHGSTYVCKDYPFSGWCGQVGYEPGASDHWQDAWEEITVCSDALSTQCSDHATWQAQPYEAGDIVRLDTNLYQCKDWPASQWCGLPGYEPGGLYWTQAWDLISTCQ